MENYFLNQMMYVSFNNTTTDVTYGVENTNISGAPEFTTGFSGFCVIGVPWDKARRVISHTK
jgi:hypothetical protein